MQIWKFRLAAAVTQEIRVPAGAKPLHVSFQDDHGICLWALVSPSAPLHCRTVLLSGTGQDIPPHLVDGYLGTFTNPEGTLVFHCFTDMRATGW